MHGVPAAPTLRARGAPPRRPALVLTLDQLQHLVYYNASPAAPAISFRFHTPSHSHPVIHAHRHAHTIKTMTPHVAQLYLILLFSSLKRLYSEV